jgi:hypothetical protein
MKAKLFDIIKLNTDIPSHGLIKGDSGTVVEVYNEDDIEVEFTTDTGATRALATLHQSTVEVIWKSEEL